MARIVRNQGFDGRTFLLEEEWLTYCRRKPVRYIRKQKESECSICGKSDTPGNSLQNAHIISFDIGVIDLALTPDFLDSDANIITAHRNSCNRAAELNLPGAMARLRSLGIEDLPPFLPEHIRALWREETAE